MITKHYVPEGQPLTVKPGQRVEAGDALSEGVRNPAEVVAARGVGEGRLYWVDAMRHAFKDNGLPVNRRNLEILARGVVNHARVEDADGIGDHLPDDVVSFSALEHAHQPSKDAQSLHPSRAHGMFLERPALHYSLGTRVTPRVAKDLAELGENEVLVSPKPPAFAPQMQRLMEGGDPGSQDWMTSMGSSYVGKHLLENVISGKAVSDTRGTSPLPALAYGMTLGKPDKGKATY